MDQMIQSGREDIKQTMSPGGHYHSNGFWNKYGIRAHDLRAFAITKLTLEGVSQFIIYEITRHSILGIFDVVKIYTRPTIEEVWQAMELI